MALLIATLLLTTGASLAAAQQPVPANVHQREADGKAAIQFLLYHYTVDARALAKAPHASANANGAWTFPPERPSECPRDDSPCMHVWFQLPNTDVICKWTVLLNEDRTAGKVLDENDEAARYMLARLTPEETAAALIHREIPRYPSGGDAHISGSVQIRVVVNTSGRVEDARMESGPATLSGAALEAVRRWTFKPYTVGTRTVPFRTILTFTFDGSGMNKVRVTP